MIGKMGVKNRVIMAPCMSFYATTDGYPSDRSLAYYSERAGGGAGLIVVEASYARLGGYVGRLGCWDDKFIPPFRKLVEAIHEGGAKAVAQVNTHRGRADEHDPAAPSAIPHPYTGKMAREMTVTDIKQLVDEFGEGIRRMKEAGFDGVMIHNCTGYLVQEFLSPATNKRTDEYGGDLRGRAKFALELAEVTRAVVGPDYPVIIRLGADDRTATGFKVNEAIEVCKMYQDAGVDMIDITTGSAEAHWWTSPFMFQPPGCNTDVSEAIKRELKIPVGVVGKIYDPYLAEEILREEKADFICIGRGLIAEPHWVNKVRDGRIEDIRKCIACSKCGEDAIISHIPMRCSINPAAGREKEFYSKLKRKTRQKKVLVIGGGPGGMQAAIIAAQKGHDVHLWEKCERLGGQLNLAIVPSGKSDIGSLLEYLITQLRKAKVTVKLGKESSVKNVDGFAPDAVIVASGSTTFIPDILGIDREIVVTCRQVLSGQREVGGKVITMGGGFVGCETSWFLAEKGKKVTLVFRSPEAALDIKYPSTRSLYLNKLADNNVIIVAGIKQYKEITPEGLMFIDCDGNEVLIEADNIVLATGAVPDRAISESLKGKYPHLYEVGDCVNAREIREAIHEGAWAALSI
jgi:2,4-dienoyl-CoA reductase-like NADH-dependent reductase (Old Yellow Enzyme family)/thioredoxin reductase